MTRVCLTIGLIIAILLLFSTGVVADLEQEEPEALEIMVGYHFFPDSPYFASVNQALPGSGEASDYNAFSATMNMIPWDFNPHWDLGISFHFLGYPKHFFDYDVYSVKQDLLVFGGGFLARYFPGQSRTFYLAGSPSAYRLDRSIEGIMGVQHETVARLGGNVAIGRLWNIVPGLAIVTEYSYHYLHFPSDNGSLNAGGHVLSLGLSSRLKDDKDKEG